MALLTLFQIIFLVWFVFTLLYFKSELVGFFKFKKAKPQEKSDNTDAEIEEPDDENFVGSAESVDFSLLEKKPENENEDNDGSNDNEYEVELDADMFDVVYEDLPDDWFKELYGVSKEELQRDMAKYQGNDDAESIDLSAKSVTQIETVIGEVYNPTTTQASIEAVKTIEDINETDLIKSVMLDERFRENMEKLRNLKIEN